MDGGQEAGEGDQGHDGGSSKARRATEGVLRKDGKLHQRLDAIVVVILDRVSLSLQKLDPNQFLQVHGRPCKIHLDPAVAAAADSPATM